MTAPNVEALADPEALRITLGGKEWPIPKLAIKQLRAMQGILDPTVKAVISDNTPLADLTQKQFSDLAEVIRIGLTRAHPTMTPEEFESIETDRIELVRALAPVALQAYGKPRAPAPGEAEGVESPSTSTESAPASPAA